MSQSNGKCILSISVENVNLKTCKRQVAACVDTYATILIFSIMIFSVFTAWLTQCKIIRCKTIEYHLNNIDCEKLNAYTKFSFHF